MGLSTKQVSGDGFDWGQRLLQPGGGLELPKPPPAARRQHQQQQSEPLPCPRCGSTNTKFCYYNNYNKSQPRHFCKACKRHWTKGGTLRNVPVGGGRKNKRPKTATAVSSSSATSRASRSSAHRGITIQREQIGDQKKASSESSLYQALIPPPPSSSSQLESIIINTGNFNVKGLSHANGGDFLASTLPNLLHQNQTPPFTFSTLSSFESNPSSMSASFGSYLSNAYNFTEGLLGSMEEATTTTTTIMPTTISIVSQPWQEVPTTSSDMDMANYWNWDDINTLIPTDQLNMHWDDTEIKP